MLYATERTVTNPKDGTTLQLYQWLPTETLPSTGVVAPAAKAHLIIVHGYLEHGMRYAEFANVLASEHGIAVTVFDVRGHGSSSGPRGYVHYWSDYHDDLDAVIQEVSTFAPTTPLFVLGHSNGGLIALSYFLDGGSQAHRQHVRGLLITCPWLAPAAKLPYIKILASKILGRILPSLTLPVNAEEVSGKVLMHDENKIKEHDTDERNLHRITVGWAYQSLLTQQQVLDAAAAGASPWKLPIPLWYAFAEQDMVANPAVNRTFGEQIQSAVNDKTVVERKGSYHEILNETDRVELYGQIAAWILQRATTADSKTT